MLLVLVQLAKEQSQFSHVRNHFSGNGRPLFKVRPHIHQQLVAGHALVVPVSHPQAQTTVPVLQDGNCTITKKETFFEKKILPLKNNVKVGQKKLENGILFIVTPHNSNLCFWPSPTCPDLDNHLQDDTGISQVHSLRIIQHHSTFR